MRAYVFTDRSLARHAGQFVWLEIDSENPKNAAFRRKYTVEALPTFFVLDAAKEQATLRWLGGLTVSQLHSLLDDVSITNRTSPTLLAKLAHADSVFGGGDNAGAVAAYRAVLADASPGWSGYSRVIESLLYSLSQTGANEQGVRLARDARSRLGRSPSGLNVAAGGLDCSLNLPDTLSGRAGTIAEFETATRALVSDTSFSPAADDRSGAWINLLSARDDAKDAEGHKRVAGEWSAFLDREAAKARTADERMVFDSHRLSAYLELGEAERAIPMLEQSERAAPGVYNPPARLATAYKAMKWWAEALAASDRALARAYGPRKLLLYTTRADIYTGRGEPAAARRTLEEAIAFATALPEGQRSVRSIDNLSKKLAALAAN